MKAGRPGSRVFSHGQVSRLSSFSSLSEIVFFCWLNFMLRQFLPEDLERWLLLCFSLTLEDANLRIRCLFLTVCEIGCFDLAERKDIYYWGAWRDVGAQCSQIPTEAEQDAQLLPGKVAKKS